MATIYDCAQRPSKDVYEEISKDFKDMNECIDRASKLGDQGKIDEAIGMYEFAISLIDKALGKPLESPSEPDIEWERAYAIVMKMRKTRKEILSRISDVQSRPHPEAALPPPSYEEAMAHSNPSIQPSVAFPVPSTRVFPGPSNQQNNAFADATIKPPFGYTGPPPIGFVGPQEKPATTAPNILPNSQPYIPSSDYNSGSSDSTSPGLYPDISDQLNEMRVSGNHEIIYSHNNVRLYFIAPDGRVSSTMEPDTLVIGRMEDLTHDDVMDETLMSIVDDLVSESKEEGKHKHSRHHRHRHHRRHRGHHGEPTSPGTQVPQGTGQIYLRVGSWVYPLIPGISPCFRSDFGAFILPDIHSQVEGAAVGLILPPTADASVYELLTSILYNVVGTGDLAPKPPARSRRSDRRDKRSESTFSTNVVRGASYLANNLVRGAGSASKFLDSAAPRLMNRLTPNTDPQPINPAVKTSVSVAKTVSSTAANVTDYLATKVGSAATSLGQYLAPHIQKQGTRLLSSTTSMSRDEASKKVEGFLDATAGAVQGIATVYTGLESAAGILGHSLANNTVQIIQYKYGQPAGEVTNDAITTAGNLYTVHGNYRMFKPKGVAKTVAKGAVTGAGQAIMEDLGSRPAPQPGFIDPSSVDTTSFGSRISPIPPGQNISLGSAPSSGETSLLASNGFKAEKGEK